MRDFSSTMMSADVAQRIRGEKKKERERKTS